MSVHAMSWVWAHSRARKGQRLVLLAIADSASADGNNAWPSISELCRKSALSETAVHAAIRGLVHLGELEVATQAGPGRRNMYRVVMQGAETNRVRKRHRADSAPRSPQNRHPEGADSAPGTILNHPEPSLAPNPAVGGQPAVDSATHGTGRGELRAALFAACNIDPAEIPETASGKYNRAVAELRGIGASPDDIRARAGQFRRIWPDATLTPTALVHRWAELTPRVWQTEGPPKSDELCPEHLQVASNCGGCRADELAGSQA